MTGVNREMTETAETVRTTGLLLDPAAVAVILASTPVTISMSAVSPWRLPRKFCKISLANLVQ